MKNKEVIELYSAHMKKMVLHGRIKITTANDHLIKLKAFSKFCDSTNEQIINASDDFVMNYLSEKERKASTKNTLMTILKKFYHLLDEQKIVDISSINFTRAKTIKKPHAFLTKTETKALKTTLEAFSKTWYGKRDAAILLLFFNTGIRVGELVKIKKGDLNRDEGTLLVYGKGDKIRTAMLPDNEFLNWALDTWERVRPQSDRAYFSNKGGRGLTPRRVQQIVKNYFENSGIEKNLIRTSQGPHLMRHNFATELVNSGVDLSIIQELLGHADISTTTIYAKVKRTTMKEAINKLNF